MRKFKHLLGLLLLAAFTTSSVYAIDPPDSIDDCTLCEIDLQTMDNTTISWLDKWDATYEIYTNASWGGIYREYDFVYAGNTTNHLVLELVYYNVNRTGNGEYYHERIERKFYSTVVSGQSQGINRYEYKRDYIPVTNPQTPNWTLGSVYTVTYGPSIQANWDAVWDSTTGMGDELQWVRDTDETATIEEVQKVRVVEDSEFTFKVRPEGTCALQHHIWKWGRDADDAGAWVCLSFLTGGAWLNTWYGPFSATPSPNDNFYAVDGYYEHH